jgi:hypothetical protein
MIEFIDKKKGGFGDKHFVICGAIDISCWVEVCYCALDVDGEKF